jgi:subtilisin
MLGRPYQGLRGHRGEVGITVLSFHRSRLPIVVAALALLTVGVTPAAAGQPRSEPPPSGAYIVVLRDGVREAGQHIRALESARGFKASREFRLLNAFAARLSPAQVAQLRADPSVAMVSEDRPVRAITSFPMTSGDSAPAGVRRIAAATADHVRDPSGTGVAVIDSGIDLAHPDLNAAHGVNCVGSGPATDNNGHGTHVAGTIGARNNGSGVVGVAPGTRVVSVKVLNAKGEGNWSQVICGIDWIASTLADSDPHNDIRVANMSLGGLGTQVTSCSTTTDALHKAICRATTAGVTFVVAAGNEGWDFDHPTQPNVPAVYPEVLTVTAMTDSDGLAGGAGGGPTCKPAEPDDRYASYSNWAQTKGGAAHAIAAPGTCVRSTAPGGGYTVMSGTSMASPHVAGAVALCLDTAGQPGPCAGLTPAQVIAKVRADAAAATTANSSYGFNGDPLRQVGNRTYGHLVHVGIEPLGGSGGPSGTGTAPQVTSTTPAGGSVGQSSAGQVSITFDRPVNRVVTEAAFSLARPNGSTVSGSFAWQGDRLVFKPSAALPEGTTFKGRLEATARSVDGVPLAGPVQWTFRTAVTGTRAAIGAVVEQRSVRAGDYGRLAANDGSFFEINSSRRKTYTTSWYARFGSVPRDALSLSVSYAGRNTRTCSQVIQAWSFASGSWVQLDARSVGRTKVLINATLPGTLSAYVSGTSASGELRIRVRCTNNVGTFYARADYMRLAFSRP